MKNKRHKGIILVMAIIIAFVLLVLGFAVLFVAEQEAVLTRIENDKAKAFYYAEAGLSKLSESLKYSHTGVVECIPENTIDYGIYRVEVDANGGAYHAISTGVQGVIQKKIRVRLKFLAAPFEDAIFAVNKAGGNWALQLRGTGNPVATKGGGEKGGRDIVNGNIFVDGDIMLYEQSSVNPAPAPNIYQLGGDARATGNISVNGSASISGSVAPGAEDQPPVDLVSMDYAHNNTYDVAKVFQSDSTNSTTLPPGHVLRDVFGKNPANRSNECASTAGNDYFLEPVNVSGSGQNQKSAPTPLHLGDNKIYYVDGDVWIHNNTTYGFTVDGKATIVATGSIHICDNIKYANDQSVLGLVALGQYDGSGNLVSGGDIYFGDPRYGTMYEASAMMFAAKDFFYNTDTVTNKPAEPTTGFIVNGNFTAMDKVTVERDWYTKSTGQGNQTEARPARFNPATGQWLDSSTGAVLSSSETGSLRHYQMIMNYDDRVRNIETQPPGLPTGGSTIFAGFTDWEEL